MEKCCEQCGKLFQTNYKQQKFCSAKCRDKSRSLKIILIQKQIGKRLSEKHGDRPQLWQDGTKWNNIRRKNRGIVYRGFPFFLFHP